MKFEIVGQKGTEQKSFYYDNTTNTLTDTQGNIWSDPRMMGNNGTVVKTFSKTEPLKKSSTINILKIQMGLSCNYSCDYCSQKFVERADQTTSKDIENFMSLLDKLNFVEQNGLKVEFWGGEPFVYWKTFKPLAEAIHAKFSEWQTPPEFSVITNGSLLTKDISDWLEKYNFALAISHDGPGQFVRGPDPLDDPERRTIILDIYRKFKQRGKISFNSMLNARNTSRKKIHEWFVNFTGDVNVGLGEGTFVDAYDEDGKQNLMQTKKEHFAFRKQAFNDIYSTNGNIGFFGILNKIDNFMMNVMSRKPSANLGQKCGMDDEHVIAVDLRGNVITCQNVSAVDTSKNNEPHLSGNLSAIEEVSITTSTHWSNREECPKCPVLHLCKGSCMFLDGELWKKSCDNAYSDNVPLFALAMERLTGYIPVQIKNEELALDRQDIWGELFEHKETVRRMIPIKIVSSTEQLGDVTVYTKSEIKEQK